MTTLGLGLQRECLGRQRWVAYDNIGFRIIDKTTTTEN
jgi:hypothetical protein